MDGRLVVPRRRFLGLSGCAIVMGVFGSAGSGCEPVEPTSPAHAPGTGRREKVAVHWAWDRVGDGRPHDKPITMVLNYKGHKIKPHVITVKGKQRDVEFQQLEVGYDGHGPIILTFTQSESSHLTGTLIIGGVVADANDSSRAGTFVVEWHGGFPEGPA